MLFKRRKKLSIPQYIKKFWKISLSPRRTITYLKHRLLRIPHSAHDIAMGFSSGVAISWTPTFGFHIIQCYIFCKLTRANFPAAVIGTFFGNPWTFPIMIFISYLVGNFVVDLTSIDRFIELKTRYDLYPEDSFGVHAFFPTLVGGYLMAVLTFPVYYFIFYALVAGARRAREKVGSTVTILKDKRKNKK